MKRLWVVEFRSDNVPSPTLVPDYEEEGIEVVIADVFFAVVNAEYDHLDRVVSKYPYCHITGQPADGRFIGENGGEVYIYDASLLETEQELWERLGLKPQDFGGETWDDVDDDIVRDQVPSF